jgi:polyphosphate glucokinase
VKRCDGDVVEHLVAALEPKYVALGGGNAEKIGKPSSKTRLGDNGAAFDGGFRLWAEPSGARPRGRTS